MPPSSPLCPGRAGGYEIHLSGYGVNQDLVACWGAGSSKPDHQVSYDRVDQPARIRCGNNRATDPSYEKSLHLIQLVGFMLFASGGLQQARRVYGLLEDELYGRVRNSNQEAGREPVLGVFLRAGWVFRTGRVDA